jgi:hypothetical protein
MEVLPYRFRGVETPGFAGDAAELVARDIKLFNHINAGWQVV